MSRTLLVPFVVAHRNFHVCSLCFLAQEDIIQILFNDGFSPFYIFKAVVT